MDFSQRNPIEKVFSTTDVKISIAGWVQQVRNLGGLRFIQLQDRTGIVQIVLPKKKVSEEIFALDFQEG
ncbi:MAG: hypothetical protein GPJ50_15490, partial [Candidatus Heimdallarchaeota archaeon]|nr:hypothetical protein [Candidatus Heimdallarchaeota archaeon]